MSDKDDKTCTVVEEAKERYQSASDAYSANRMLAIKDTRFALGDSDNGWQWPDDIHNNRRVGRKVCLTVNMTAQHCNQVINNIRQNRPQCRVLPVDSGADKKTAEIMAGLVRNIQTSSNADDAHDIGAEHSIYGGEGFWRIITDYESTSSFNQIIKIKAIQNPLLVYIDPFAQEPDKSDAEWGFIFEDISKEQCKREHPDVDPASWIEDSTGWVSKESIRRAEYFYCEYKDDTALLLVDESTALKSDLQDGQYDDLMAQGAIVKERPTQRKMWKWCKILGGCDEPLDERDWLGSYLPIIPVIGKEVNVNGEIVRKGMVRDLKDPARMVNFSYSEAIQTVALQNKIPYIAAAEAIEGYESEWKVANTSNAAYLPYNAFDESGSNPIPAPQRQEPAVMPAAQVQMLQLSTEQMRAASGQQNANFGIKSEAASGVGIQRLKAQGEIATFHFPDNLVRALRYEAKVLIDLIPKIYDTKRVVRILGIDGKDEKATLDPDMSQPYDEYITEDDVQKIFNPSMGTYDVVIDTGPSYQTQRQEAAANLTELASKSPIIMQAAPDLIMRAYDFPMADQIANRLEKTLPPNLQDKKGKPQIPPEVQQQMQQMQQTIQQLDQAIQKMTPELEDRDIDWYKAKTDRFKVEADVALKEQAQAMAPQEMMQRFDALEQMMLDVMRNSGHLSHLENQEAPQQEEQESQMQAAPEAPQTMPPTDPNMQEQ